MDVLSDKTLTAAPEIAILGAGFSGMAMAIQLKQSGSDNFTIYEKADEVGGTWRDNTYPGVACDVPSHLYSFSYEPNPSWTRRYSQGSEIWDYMKRCAEKHGLYQKTRFGKTVVCIRHDGKRWRIDFDDGTNAQADVVVSGLGGLHEPSIPEFDGIENFNGAAFHTARWRHDLDLTGKRVAVIGSAASAIQVIPEIAPNVRHLDVFQRTANWVFPRRDYAYPKWLKGFFESAPFLARIYRGIIFSIMEWRFSAFKKGKNFMKRRVRRMFAHHIKTSISDPELRRKVTPDYPIGCKRILASDDYFPALERANVDLVESPITGIEKSGIRTEEGELREADVIVFATGFKPFDIVQSIDVIGPSGLSLRDVWAEKITAHRTVAAPGFPNFFMLLGPNSGLGHNSVISIIEAQVNYIIGLIEKLRNSGASLIEPSPGAAQAFDDQLQTSLKDMVWAGGCKSWYLDKNGRNYTLYAHSVRHFVRDMAIPELSEYVLTPTVHSGE